MPSDTPIKLTVNGREVATTLGRLLIDVAEGMDIFVPRFCYHPGLESVAACRMCLVEVEGAKKLLPACATPATDGMVVRTDAPAAVDAQRSVLELLLINHPLDCPICDRGGECPLQDQALALGPGTSRYQEEKRHFPKPIPISDLVLLDRERCVLCWRCVRFCDEVAGDPFIELVDRGSQTQVNIAPDEPFDSHFSGNTIQICPVGALTAAPYRFESRPWDLMTTASVCSFCAVGCPISLERRGGEVLRAQALPNEHVNRFWNCDKGRFGHRYVSHPDRLRSPLVRRTGESGEAAFEEASWEEALSEVARRLRSTLEAHGPHAAGLVGGAHTTNEDLHAAARFFREVVGSPNLDARIADAAFPYERLAAATGGLAGSSAALDDLDHARAILWFGPDPKEELPVLYLRLRAGVQRGARLVIVQPRRISLSALGIHLRPAPGREAAVLAALAGGDADHGVDPALLTAAREALGAGPVVVCAGQPFAGLDPAPALDALAGLARSLGARVLACPPAANSQGAIDLGVHPGVLPGHRSGPAGLGTTGMLRAAAEGSLKFLWVLGADLTADVPDAQLVQAALSGRAFVVVSELFATETARAADVVLPAASLAEQEGSTTNLERRLQKLSPVVAPPGAARAAWHVFADLAGLMGNDWGWATAADVAADVAARVPTHAGFSWDRLAEPVSLTAQAHTSPPEVGHPTGSSGQALGAAAAGGRATIGPGRSAGSWPLRWELRAVDATRRRGWVWEGAGALEAPPPAPAGPPPAPPPEHPLVLLAGRALFDAGQMVSRSADLAAVVPEAFAEIHPEEARARGLAEGDDVRVSSHRGSLRTRLRVSEDTPPGAAFVLYDQPGMRANLLLDAGRRATFVEVSL